MRVFKFILWYLVFIREYIVSQDLKRLTNLEHIVKLRCQLISDKHRYSIAKENIIKKCKTENPQSKIETPEVPTNLQADSPGNKKEKSFQITWEMPYGSDSSQKTIKYQIETRFYLGVFKPINELYYSPWQWQDLYPSATSYEKDKKSVISYNMKVRRGYWYQFRVAAINSNGFRNMSKPSEPFKIEKDPKIPAQAKFLTIDSYNLNTKNTINVTLNWCPPKSDVPVKRYKISWALHIMDKALDKDSVLVRHAFVSGVSLLCNFSNIHLFFI